MTLLATPIAEWHRQHGAKMAEFAGWDMPIQYSGIIQEHNHTRTAASIFDICHMGEFVISGANAAEELGKAISTNLATLKQGKCRYGFLLNDNGGIIDDLITYRLEEEKFMLVVNASCRSIDLEILRKRLPESISIKDISDNIGKIDLQGPMAREALQEVMPGPWADLGYFSFMTGEFDEEKILVSRTGYTGEFGYELYVSARKTLEIWEILLSSELVEPAGLGARDTLRLEAGLPLNGQDLDTAHTPAEAGYIAMLTSEADFTGKQNALDVHEVLIGLKLEGRRSARHGHQVLLADGTGAGVVTSASFAPSLGYAVALAYIKKEYAEHNDFVLQADKVQLAAKREEMPFYKAGTARKKI